MPERVGPCLGIEPESPLFIPWLGDPEPVFPLRLSLPLHDAGIPRVGSAGMALTHDRREL